MANEVTIVIPFYNVERYIKQAVDSVLKQTYPHWRLIMVNDGSTDQSVSHIQPYLSDPRITLIHNTTNMGQSYSLNRALAQIKTPYFVQLDGDDWFFPYTLEVLIKEMEKQPSQVAAIGGNAMVYVEDDAGNRKMTYLRRSRPIKDKYEFLLSNLSLWPRFYRTAIIKTIGGWSTEGPDQGRWLEDKQILYKLLTHQYSLHWIDQTLYNYRRHRLNLTNNIEGYNRSFEWLIEETLKAWGNQYQPVYITYGIGWKKVGKLVPNNNQKQVAQPPQNQLHQNQPASNPVQNQTVAAKPQQSPSVQKGPSPVQPQTAANLKGSIRNTIIKHTASKGVGTGPYTGPGTAPGTGPGT